MSTSNKLQPSFRDIEWWMWIVLATLLLLAIALIWGSVRLFAVFWSAFTDLDKTVAAAIVAGVFTVVASTITVMVGRYFEERRKQSELHREKKIAMYDAFIARIFRLFANEAASAIDSDKDTDTDNKGDEKELIEFLREQQRQFLLWSNAGVIRAFAEWQKSLSAQPSAQTILQMEKFFLAVRRDLGHSNWGIKQGDTARYLLRHTDFFLEQIKSNPNITLHELAEKEKEFGLNEPYEG